MRRLYAIMASVAAAAHRAAGREAEAARHARLGEQLARRSEHLLLARQARDVLADGGPLASAS
ncbi:hypothetical protein [Micromonospora sp. NPDC023814]|uniref:hypothetical protein n=1 Tax=Micromonospora sp. NPDC023814 TaxID=3154596 RepID=UPI0033FA190D